MKLLILLTLILPFSVFAQTGLEENTQPKEIDYVYNPLNHMRTHAFVGLTYFNLDGDIESDAKPSVTVGVNAETGQGLVYQIGVKYSHMKMKSNSSASSPFELKLNYLHLTLGGKYYFSGDNNGFFVRGNLNPSLLVSSSTDGLSVDPKDFNLFAEIGAGYAIPGNPNLTVDLSYNHGLMDVIKSNSSEATVQGVQATLGFLF